MKKYTITKINNKEIWYRIYGSRAGKTLEISTPQDKDTSYSCLRLPYDEILRGENETMEEYIKKEVNNYKFNI